MSESKRKTDREQPTSVDTGGGAYVGGSVYTSGGDFVGRDQIISIQETHGEVTLEAFLALLAELRQGLSTAKLDPDTAQAVQTDLQTVEAQAQKARQGAKPSRALIVGKLKGVAEMLTEAGKVATAAASLLPLVEKALTWAGRLFR